jgi:hypothetical protein
MKPHFKNPVIYLKQKAKQKLSVPRADILVFITDVNRAFLTMSFCNSKLPSYSI